MNRCPSGVHIGFHPVYGPATTHEHQGYHMDIEDCLAVTFCLVGKIIHKDSQANFLAAEEMMDVFYHEGQYSQRTFQAKR